MIPDTKICEGCEHAFILFFDPLKGALPGPYDFCCTAPITGYKANGTFVRLKQELRFGKVQFINKEMKVELETRWEPRVPKECPYQAEHRKHADTESKRTGYWWRWLPW